MANAEEARVSICGKFGFKPLTCENILFYYAPMQSVASYTALAANVMNPTLITRVFPKRDVTNILLFNTIIGTTLYLYNRPHLENLDRKDKLLFSAFGAVAFSLGSILIWAIGRNIVPQNVALCTVLGVGSGLALMKVGKNYVAQVDSLVKPPN